MRRDLRAAFSYLKGGSKEDGSRPMEKPLWLRDMYLPLDSIRKKSMAQKLYDRESSDEEEIFNRADVR
uniref:Uncharacterized protein n=1 Tax=Chelonoidis abingdonii TaxID=106734 RepID=A0A8C0HAQ5_CHEAB